MVLYNVTTIKDYPLPGSRDTTVSFVTVLVCFVLQFTSLHLLHVVVVDLINVGFTEVVPPPSTATPPHYILLYPYHAPRLT